MSDFNKLMVIGLDGGTWDAFDRFIELGYMPNLARLKERSANGVLNSTILPFTMPAWTTFFTGRNPGSHGIMSFWQQEPEGYNLDNVGEFVNSTILGPANLWSLMSRKGRKLIVINVPLTYPPQPINGVMVTGMLTPPDAENMTYPPELKHELEALQALPETYFVRHLAIQQSSEGLWFRISEWVDTLSWGTLLATGRLKDPRICLRLFYRIASILDGLHRIGHIIPHLILDDILVYEDQSQTLKVLIDYKLSRFLDPQLDRPSPMLARLLSLHPDIVNQRPLDQRSGFRSRHLA